MKPKIWLSSPHLGGRELEFVQDVFATNWVAPLGPHVDGFEQDLQAYTDAPYAAALSSDTAALHLALINLGVAAQDEVLCATFTFNLFSGATRITATGCPSSFSSRGSASLPAATSWQEISSASSPPCHICLRIRERNSGAYVKALLPSSDAPKGVIADAERCLPAP